MTPRTLATFAAGALVGLKLRDALLQVANVRLQLHDVLRGPVDELEAARHRVDDLSVSLAELTGRLHRLEDERRDRALVSDDAVDLWRRVVADESSDVLTGLVSEVREVHQSSPSSMGATSEGKGAGGSQTSPPAPTSGARS